MPNKLSQFWLELKRRKVTRVITVYAAAAFVILELTDIVAPSLGLPDWTLNFIIILLCVGFIITVILSWIYDVHPEEGIIKTEPADKLKTEEIPKSSNGWKIASYISFVVILGLILLNVIPRTKQVIEKEILEKSIAVLPFINDSEEIGNEHFINGVMEEILINLQSIKELRVPGRTSTEPYRNNPKPIPEIADEMNVAYIVEGSGQRYGNKIRLRVQLVEGATDKHLWADSYDEVINGPEDIFRIQSQIAKSIAEELQAVITPAEMQQIERVPTTSLSALDYYLKGREMYINYLLNLSDLEAIRQAEKYFHQALDYDSTFAQAYTGLAMVYYSNMVSLSPFNNIISEDYLDSSAFDPVLHWANKALQYDDHLAEAYVVRGKYYFETGQREKAEKDYKTALGLNPNLWEANFQLGELFMEFDNVKAFDYIKIAASLNRGYESGLALFRIWQFASLFELADEINSQVTGLMRLSLDSASYYSFLSYIEGSMGNTEQQIQYIKRAYEIDSSMPWVIHQMASLSLKLGDFQDGIRFFEKGDSVLNNWGKVSIQNRHRLGYIYFQAGLTEEAEEYFNWQEEICKKLIQLNRPLAQCSYAHYDLAGVYAFRGEKEKALELLSYINQKSFIPIAVGHLIESDRLFDKIRDDKEFQRIEGELMVKYEEEKERIRQWLVENDML